MATARIISLGLVIFAIFVGATGKGRAAILSSKRGFADTGANYNNLQATGAGWYYTWGTGAANPGSFDANHVPMFWSGTPSQNTINSIKNNPNVDWVLGFNEPERPDQANMTVAQAVSSWTTISNGFAGSNIKLVSPAVADTGGATGGQAWLASFMSQAAAANLTVDAVAFHWYGVSNPDNPAGAASSFLSRVASYHDQYGKPVVISEFAIHDWGGNYSDDAIIEANRQFLDIVIPELEARDYVMGYSWYHWFSDAHLYEGSPSTPTPMARSYVGALTNGSVEDIGGRNLGEHVAYLAGGELTATGAAPSNFNYINALSSTSSISGTVDWGLVRGDWIRIQSGATLRKTGVNEISISAPVTNNGVLEVTQGSLRIRSAVAGGGNVVVDGGTLALAGQATIVQAPLIDVRASGVFDVSGLSSEFIVSGGQTLNCVTGATVVGNITAGTGSLVAGGGALLGNVTVQSGAVVRVGDDGAGTPSRFVVDDFESYALGNVRDVASPPWTAHQNTGLADIEDSGSNKVLSYGYVSDFRGTSRNLPDDATLDNSKTATYFFRVNSKTDDPDHNVGLGDQATTGGVDFGDFEAQIRLKQDSASGTFAVDARNGSGFSATLASGLALDTWYNVWMVVDQSTDTYDVYLNTGSLAANAGDKLNAMPLSFRNGTASDLNTFLALAGPSPIDNGVRIDDLAYLNGFDLTNPLGRWDPGLIWSAETLTINGDYTQDPAATLELNLLDPDHRDVLAVTGHVDMAGTLAVSLATGAPAPQLGDVFDILDFASADGTFTLNLPSLSSGLFWNTNELLATGTLAVVAGIAGDYNGDGIVDAADYTVWRNNLGAPAGTLLNDIDGGVIGQAQYGTWKVNFGRSSDVGSLSNAVVPEPTSGRLLILTAACVALGSANRRGTTR